LASPSLYRLILHEDEPLGLHFAVSRHMVNGQAFVNQLNTSIAEIQKNKMLQNWLYHFSIKPQITAIKPEPRPKSASVRMY
jgi:hypothetical protein